jgi:N-acetyl-alpha-D-muramate 1-phosphate uridylyltransferase
MKAMLLAAGRGERMAALTVSQPKPLLEVGGMALIERHVARLAAAGVRELFVNLSYRGAQIRERLGDGARYGVTIEYSDEGEPPLETAGGIVHALPLLGREPFLLVNSDVLTDFDCSQLRTDSARNSLVLVPNPDHHPRGDFGIDGTGHVSIEGPLLTYAGLANLGPELFTEFPPGRRPLKPVLDAAIARGLLRAIRYDGLWLDVGTPERLERGRRILAGR